MCKKYTEEFLLSELRRFYEENGRSPTQKDLQKNDIEYPRAHIYYKRFKGLNNALQLAELPINLVHQYDRNFLISEIYRFIEENDRVPMYDDMDVTPGYPSATAYRREFGTWNNTLIAAGLDINLVHQYDRNFLISEIYRFVEENGKVPTQEDMCNKNGYPSYMVFIREFGSFNNSLIYCGFKPNRILHTYNGTETCTICGKYNRSSTKWNYDDNGNRICDRCDTSIWRKKNPDKIKKYKHTCESKRRGYGSVTLNDTFECSEGHHLWLENRSDFSIFIPTFLHQLYSHDHNKPETMITPNAIALDYLINEEYYIDLYLTGGE